MSQITEIADHSSQAIDRLTSQFKDKEKISGFISAFVDQVQELETVFQDLLSDRSLNQASGEQLDGLGRIVGIERGGRNDADYKNLIIAKIGQNTSKGLAENLINVFILLTSSSRVHFIEYYPAECEIYADVDISTLNTEDIYEFCQKVLSGGVRLNHIGWFDADEAFAFDGEPDGLGFGDALDETVGGKFASISE